MQGSSNEFRFITRRSAQYGADSIPVLATDRYEGASKRLLYSEGPVPPWWNLVASDYVFLSSRLRNGNSQSPWEGVLFHDLATAQFEYWDTVEKRWNSQWRNADKIAPVLKFSFVRAGQSHELVLETAASSFYSRSGS